jgi:aminoglycoside phosphotransferase (APT) family kinase protein
MHTDEVNELAAALGQEVVATRKLAGGFSHETCLLTLADGPVVARLGGQDPAIEAAVMTAARGWVPVPEVLLLLPAVGKQGRPAMVISHVAGTPLSDVLAHRSSDLAGLGAEVGRVTAAISAVCFERPGFFLDAKLSLRAQPSWSRQLPEFAESCMSATPPGRLDEPARRAWAALCATHAPELERIDDQARLAHADLNPKNILVTHAEDGWRVDAVLDWEFSYSSSPYGDAANMARFADDYPAPFLAGFLESFGAHQPTDLPPPPDWLYLGRLLDMFALSDLVTRSIGHPIADRAAAQIRRWLATGIPS